MFLGLAATPRRVRVAKDDPVGKEDKDWRDSFFLTCDWHAVAVRCILLSVNHMLLSHLFSMLFALTILDYFDAIYTSVWGG